MQSNKWLHLAQNRLSNGTNRVKATDMRSPITSARKIGDHVAVVTARGNADSARLEAKLNLVITQIANLSSQFDAKLTAVKINGLRSMWKIRCSYNRLQITL